MEDPHSLIFTYDIQVVFVILQKCPFIKYLIFHFDYEIYFLENLVYHTITAFFSYRKSRPVNLRPNPLYEEYRFIERSLLH